VLGERLTPGWHTLGTGGERDGVVSVPAAPGPLPLIVMLHGAGGTGRRAAQLLGPAAFTHLLAFSPGFLIPARPTGAPVIFVSHGVGDQILPIDRCSRRLVPALRRQGYRVRYREFQGRHEAPPPSFRRG
jgi:predicted esterase